MPTISLPFVLLFALVSGPALWAQESLDLGPDGDIVVVAPGDSGTVVFTLTNLGQAPAAFTLECAGEGVVECDGLERSIVEVAPGASASVRVRYRLSGLGVGSIVLRARSPETNAVVEAGHVTLRGCGERCS